MKKIIMATVLSLGIVACGDNEPKCDSDFNEEIIDTMKKDSLYKAFSEKNKSNLYSYQTLDTIVATEMLDGVELDSKMLKRANELYTIAKQIHDTALNEEMKFTKIESLGKKEIESSTIQFCKANFESSNYHGRLRYEVSNLNIVPGEKMGKIDTSRLFGGMSQLDIENIKIINTIDIDKEVRNFKNNISKKANAMRFEKARHTRPPSVYR